MQREEALQNLIQQDETIMQSRVQELMDSLAAEEPEGVPVNRIELQ